MNKKEYFDFHRIFCEQMQEITKKKNADYTGAGDDPFANFRKIEALTNGAVSVEAGFLTRMTDKFSRIGSFLQKGELQVKDESVIDTLLDLANYSALLAGYIASKRPTLSGSEPVESCPHSHVDKSSGRCLNCGLPVENQK